MPVPRPYGVGAYGVGPYSRYAGTIHVVGAATSIAFVVYASEQRVVDLHPLTQIEFVVWGRLHASWVASGPCAGGAWSPMAPATGNWQPVDDCATGTWKRAA